MSKGYRGFWRLNRRKNSKARKARVQSPLQLGHEALEGKRLLAFAPLPTPGDQGGSQIVLLSDDLDSSHELSVILDDQTNVGSVTATITAFDGTTLQTGQFFNFSGISYTASNDTDGSVSNKVSLWTSYNSDLLGQETSPAADAAVGLSTNWLVTNQFTGTSTPTLLVDLLNADALTVTSGIVGGGASTIAGEFESPTLPPDLDASTGANITLNAGAGITAAASSPIVSHTLTLRSQVGTVGLEAAVLTAGDLTVEAIGDVTVTSSVTSQEGTIAIRSTGGKVGLSGSATLHAVNGSLDVSAATSVQGLGADVASIDVLSGGTFYEYAIVTISPPRSGEGRAARATAVISPVVIDPATGDVTGGVITAINVIDRGFGYAAGEQIEITIEGSPGRTATVVPGNTKASPEPVEVTIPAASGARAYAVSGIVGVLIAGESIKVAAGADIALSSQVTAGNTITIDAVGGIAVSDDLVAGGDIAVSSVAGAIDLGSTPGTLLSSTSGGLTATALGGGVTLRDVNVAGDVNVTATGTVSLLGAVNSWKGDIGLTSIDRDIDTTAADALIYAEAGGVTLTAVNGSVLTPPVLNAFGDVTITSLGSVGLNNEIASQNGSILVTSTSAGINVGANLVAAGDIDLTAHSAVTQVGRGIGVVTVLAGGSGYDATTEIEIAPPAAAGGTAATARAVIGTVDGVQGVITGIQIVTPGTGYAVGELPDVIITGSGTGAVATAQASDNLQNLSAGQNLRIMAGGGVEIINTATALEGDISIEARAGNLALAGSNTFLTAPGGTVTLLAPGGSVALQRLLAEGDVGVRSRGAFSLVGALTSEGGDVDLQSALGDLDFTSSDARIYAAAGSVSLTSLNGSVLTPPVLNVGGGIEITSLGSVTLGNEIKAGSGKIVVVSTAGDINLAANIAATTESIELAAQSRVTQLGRGVAVVEVISGGAGYDDSTTVTIDPPTALGGEAATARAVIGTVNGVVGVITGIQILSPGSGYAVGEVVRVTIDGQGAGATASASASTALQNLSAGKAITIDGRAGVTLINAVSAGDGAVTVKSALGDLDLGASTLFLESAAAGIDLTASLGATRVQRLAAEGPITIVGHLGAEVAGRAESFAEGIAVTSKAGAATVRNLVARKDVTLESFGTSELQDTVLSHEGTIDVESTNNAVVLSANVRSMAADVMLTARTTVTQSSGGGLTRIDVINGGQGYTQGAEVSIAAPAGGGVAATARAVIVDEDVDGVFTVGRIKAIEVVTAGSGYAVGESPLVTIVGGENFIGQPIGAGAAATAIGPAAEQGISASRQIKITGKAGVAITNQMQADSVLLESEQGGVSFARVTSNGDVEVSAESDLAVSGPITTAEGEGGNVTLFSRVGGVSAADIIADGSIDADGYESVTLSGVIESLKGDVSAGSKTNALSIEGTIRSAREVTLTADSTVTQTPSGRIESLTVVARGSGYSNGAVVTIAPPQGGGRAATAVAEVGDWINDETGETVADGVIAIRLTDSGSGYGVGEVPLVTIEGGRDFLGQLLGSGAEWRANAPRRLDGIQGQGDVSIKAGSAISLSSIVESLAGKIVVDSRIGGADIARLVSFGDITVTAEQGVTVSGPITTAKGEGGNVTLSSRVGGVSAADIITDGSIEADGFATVALTGVVESLDGGIIAASRSGAITLEADVVAKDSITVTAQSSVTQAPSGRLQGITVQNPGAGYTEGASVTIAAPSGGGVAATAVADIGDVVIDGRFVANAIVAIRLVTAGEGYAVGEQPAVTIRGALGLLGQAVGAGASGIATGPGGVQNLLAEGDITIKAGDVLTLANTIESKSGNIQLAGARGATLNGVGVFIAAHADTGTVTIDSASGGVSLGRVSGKGGVSVTANDVIEVTGSLASARGAIGLESVGGTIVQRVSTGVSVVEVVSTGEGYEDGATVTIAAPRQGGVAATAVAAVANGRVTSIFITSPGSGYAVGENPEVTIVGTIDAALRPIGAGAVAVARGPQASGDVTGGTSITIKAASDITLGSLFEAKAGDITVESTTGVVDLGGAGLRLIASEGVDIKADAGSTTVRQIRAKADVNVDANGDLTVLGRIDSSAGGVHLESHSGAVSSNTLTAETKVKVFGFSDVAMSGIVEARTLDIDVESQAGNVTLAADVRSQAGAVRLRSAGTITQRNATGVSQIELLGPGSGYSNGATVAIAAPVGGGRAATAQAVVGRRDENVAGELVTIFFISEIQITDSGFGYAIGESPEVTITGNGGGAGAAARAFGPVGFQNVAAGTSIEFTAGEDVILANAITAVENLTVTTRRGDLVVTDSTAILESLESDVRLEATLGDATLRRVVAKENVDVNAGGAATLEHLDAGNGAKVLAVRDVAVNGLVRARAGDIEIESVSGDLAVTPDAKVHALLGGVTLTADRGAAQVGNVIAGSNLAVAAGVDVEVSSLMRADTGDITVMTKSGALRVTDGGRMHAVKGSVVLDAERGPALLQDVFAGENITLTTLGDAAVTGAVEATTGDVTITSDGNINNAARMLAGGSISLDAKLAVTSLGSGIVSLEVLSGGVNYEYAIVTIAPPASGGGRAALARATIEGGVITLLTIVDPGYGYAPDERVEVTIEGNPEVTGVGGDLLTPAASGATAVATAGSAVSSLIAGDAISISGGTLVNVTNETRAMKGGIDMDVVAGPLTVADLFAGDTVSLDAAQGINIGGLVRSAAGDVSVKSTGGGIDMNGTILAPGGAADVSAAGQIVQRGGSISRDKIFLLSGGRQYTYALVVVDPPPGAGQPALAEAVITYYNLRNPEAGGYISDIILLDGGWGYPSDSRVTVRIQGDGEGAAAVFGTDLISSSIDVRDDVSLSGGDSITLVSAVRSSAGDVSIRNTLGDISVQSITAGGSADVESERGEVTLVSVETGENAAIAAFRGVTVTDSVNTVEGDIEITTLNGDLTFVQAFDFGDNYLVDDAATVLLPRAVVASEQGAIRLTSDNGSIVTPYVLNAAKNVEITSFGALELANDITSTDGDIVATSTSGLVRLRSNMAADSGSIRVEAQTQLQQEVVTGISKIELLSPGPMLDVPPDVTVTIAAPRDGGDAAQAIAVIERRALNEGRDNDNNANNEDIIAYEYFIGSIAIIDAGRGYAVGEQPAVTITGVAGASARAYGPNIVAMLTAQDDITLGAGENITLLTKIHSVGGDITVASKTGDLNLAAGSLLLSAKAGAVSLDAEHGSAVIQRLAGNAGVTVDALYGLDVLGSVDAGNGGISLATASGSANVRHLNARDAVQVTSFQSTTLGGEIVSSLAGVTATSTAAGVFLQANVSAKGEARIDAQTFVRQDHGTGVERVDVIDEGSVIAGGGNAAVPAVTVTIAAPAAGGGVTATAQAVIGKRTLGRNAQADEETVEFFIESIFITNPGRGYALGETPIVTIEGMNGAIARGVGPTNMRNVTADGGITVTAVDDISLLNTFTATGGDIVVRSVSGDVSLDADTVNVNAEQGSVTVRGEAGQVAVRHIVAEQDITVAARDTFTLSGVLNAYEGDVSIVSSSGNLDFTSPAALIYAAVGGVSLSSTSRSILNTPTLNVGGDVAITSFSELDLKNEITSGSGDITAQSTSGGIKLSGNLNAATGSLTLVAKAGIVQQGRGITRVTMLAGGSGYGVGTLVTFAPPSAGGTAARGRAIIGTVNGVAGVIVGVEIVTPGVGYAVGEEVEVTFTGAGAGAIGFAEAGSIPQDIKAGQDVTLRAGSGVKILNAVNATIGDIEIRTINGNLDFNSTEAILSAENGGVTLSSFNGSILSPPVLHVAGDIVMEAFTAIPVANQLTSDAGSIRVASSSGSVALNANVFAAERVELAAKTGISQPNGFIQADSLVVNNGSNTAVSLGNAFNNVNQLAATTLGSFSYTDADDFETGVSRGGAVGVEIRGDGVSLTALAPLSTVRVVSGLQYRSLSISAGAAFGASVGTVEYVVTSGGDSAAPNAAFQGSLRDMTRYLNDNTATYVLNGSRVPQKSAIVFDEDGYLVEEIVVAGALPAMTKPVMFDGGRLEQTATTDRIGLRGTATTPTGLSFGLGSSGSTLTKTAAYGFTNGSAIVMASGNNTVTDVHIGMDAAGTVRANRVGLDITGTAAVNNLIGSTTFDVSTANRIVGNSLVGLLLRNGAAGNRVYGNLIGDDTGVTPGLGNGDGIRIVSSTGNYIGTPDEVQPDMVASVSNKIMGNRQRGIQISNSTAGTFAAANRLRNNYIAGNGMGVGITASRFAVLGGPEAESANVIVGQAGSGVSISGSSNVRLVGNLIGLEPAGDFGLEVANGNGGDGVFVGDSSHQVEIFMGNRIGDNGRNGVSIASGATGVSVTGNTIGGTLSDGTPAGNALDGVAISAAIGNRVGAGNVVSLNGRHGVSISDARATALSAGNQVVGSQILSNVGSGVFISGGGYSTIGTATAANRINANGGSGVRMEYSVATGAATGNVVQGNIIGADANRSVDPATGNVASGISIVAGVNNVIAGGNVIMNNALSGVEILGGSRNVVGGSGAGQGNMITNNRSNGVRIAAATGVPATAATPAGHVITGNTIADNARNGVMVGAGSAITIGQTVTATQATGSGNTIFGNLNHGVSIGAAAQQVAVQGNSIHGNALGAIGRTSGANRSATQTLSLNSATVQQTGTVSQPITITGRLSNPTYGQQHYSVDLYASNPEDGNYGALTGYQTRRFLGRATVTTDAKGVATFEIRITTPIRVGEVITANATALRFEVGSSSAESNAVVVALQNIPVPGTPTPTPTPKPAPRPTPGKPTPKPAPRSR